jgi:hypothetical protein
MACKTGQGPWEAVGQLLSFLPVWATNHALAIGMVDRKKVAPPPSSWKLLHASSIDREEIEGDF